MLAKVSDEPLGVHCTTEAQPGTPCVPPYQFRVIGLDIRVILPEVDDQRAIGGMAALDLLNCAVIEEPAMINDDDPLAQSLYIVHVVGGQNHRHPTLPVDLRDELAQTLPGHHV